MLSWSPGGESAPIDWFWLRDHCPCAECLHPETLQRQVDTFSLPADIAPRRLELTPAGEVDIVWEPDGHASRYPAALLTASGIELDPTPPAALWDSALNEHLPRVAYDDVMAGDEGLVDWLEKIGRYGFCLVSGTPANPDDTRRLAERIAYVRTTIFGGFWEFTADLSHGDTAYTNLALPPHTDGTYVHDAPGLQFLHVLEFDGSGGESLLVDGFGAAEALRREAPEAYRALTTVPIPGRYIEPGVHLKSARPALRLNGRGELAQVSFNNTDRAPFRLPDAEMKALYRALNAFHERVSAPEAQARFQLVPGEALVFDNWRVLHGRDAFEGRRRVCGCYLNHEDFESRLRALRGDPL